MPEETFTTGSVQIEEEETQVGHPPLFAVVFFNDDYTPMAVSYTHLTLPTKA